MGTTCVSSYVSSPSPPPTDPSVCIGPKISLPMASVCSPRRRPPWMTVGETLATDSSDPSLRLHKIWSLPPEGGRQSHALPKEGGGGAVPFLFSPGLEASENTFGGARQRQSGGCVRQRGRLRARLLSGGGRTHRGGVLEARGGAACVRPGYIWAMRASSGRGGLALSATEVCCRRRVEAREIAGSP
jgi:hypothetical protein